MNNIFKNLYDTVLYDNQIDREDLFNGNYGYELTDMFIIDCGHIYFGEVSLEFKRVLVELTVRHVRSNNVVDNVKNDIPMEYMLFVQNILPDILTRTILNIHNLLLENIGSNYLISIGWEKNNDLKLYFVRSKG